MGGPLIKRRWLVEFTVELPDFADVNSEHIEEWARFHMGGGRVDGRLIDRLGDMYPEGLRAVRQDLVRRGGP